MYVRMLTAAMYALILSSKPALTATVLSACPTLSAFCFSSDHIMECSISKRINKL